MDTDTLERAFPLPRTHTGFALGNGSLGALVWGVDAVNVTVNRADFWDHRGGEVLLDGNSYARMKAAYDPADRGKLDDVFVREDKPDDVKYSSRLPVGRFEIELRDGLKPERGVLELATGRLVVHVGGGAGAIGLAVGTSENVLLIEDPQRLIRGVRCRPAWEWVAEELSRYAFGPPESVLRDDLTGWVQSCPADPSLAALCGREGGARRVISLELGATNAEAVSAAESRIAGITSERFTELSEESALWWGDYHRTCPRVDLPCDWLNTFVRQAMHKLGAATHPASPVPAGLQGPWIEEYQPAQWSGDYHFNVNVQQIYTLAFAANHPEHLLPLFDMLESDAYIETMRQTANVLYGIDDGLAMLHALDDRGRQCGGISSGAVIDHSVTGWTAQLYWLYYQYTRDEDFLRDRAYPFLVGTMRVFEEILERRDGRLSIPLSISAEYAQPLSDGRSQNVGRDPSYTLACTHMLADALLAASDVLGVDPKPIWREIKASLPPFTLVGDEGAERIAVWEGQDLDICHRHHSHLACIYPFDTLGEMDERTQGIVDESIDHWILKGMGQWSEWCIPWAAIIQARLGLTESPRVLLELWREVFVNEGLATVYLPRFRGLTAHRRADMLKPKETSEIMQLDGTMAAATAVLEMLVHTRGRTTHVFPAVSEKWCDVSFEGVRTPGAFLVSARRTGGATQEVTVESLRGGAIRLDVSDWSHAMIDGPDGPATVSLPAEFEIPAGGRVRLICVTGPASP